MTAFAATAFGLALREGTFSPSAVVTRKSHVSDAQARSPGVVMLTLWSWPTLARYTTTFDNGFAAAVETRKNVRHDH
eukprot:6774069-Prymnesium_polylepis.1